MPPGDRQAAGTQPPHRWGHAGPTPPAPPGRGAELPAAVVTGTGGPPHRPATSQIPGHQWGTKRRQGGPKSPHMGGGVSLGTPSHAFCVHSCPLRVHAHICGTAEVPAPHTCTSPGTLWRCLAHSHTRSHTAGAWWRFWSLAHARRGAQQRCSSLARTHTCLGHRRGPSLVPPLPHCCPLHTPSLARSHTPLAR